MAQGFTVTTLLLLKQMKTVADTKTRKEKPPTVDHIITECFFGFELFEFPWFEDEAGEGVEIQLECGGVDTTAGGFAGVGAATGEGESEGERVKKILEGEGEGEGETSGDLNGDGEFEGLSDGETIDGDGEKGSETGDKEEEKDDGGAVCRSCRLYAISPCWPTCLLQACNL